VIKPTTGTRIWIAARFTGVRRGFQGLSSIVGTVLEQAPFSGHLFVFRGKRGDLIKLLWFDGDGLCLFQKRLERGRSIWPQARNGVIDAYAVVDASGRHRLASTAEDVGNHSRHDELRYSIYDCDLTMAYSVRSPCERHSIVYSVLRTPMR
jgi:transposase